MTKNRHPKFVGSVAGFLTALCFVAPAFAAAPPNSNMLPVVDTVVKGSVSITTGKKDMTVTQSSDRAIIDWQSFNIGTNDKVEFVQPSSTSVTLNRVTGSQSPSQIFGTLTANGTIMLVNANGIVFDKGSHVNVGGLIATTSDIGNRDFMKGNYNFKKRGNPDAEIINDGDIKIKDGGLAALVGPNVTNDGLIQANLGKVQLASGDSFSVDLYGDGLFNLQASDKIKQQLVENSGEIQANGGQVLMTAAAAREVVDSLINMDGLIQANSVATQNGKVVLSGDTVQVSGSIDATGAKKGETGGTVKVLGNTVDINSDAAIDASGQASGGFVETSGNNKLSVSGSVNAGGANGSNGTWLVESGNVVIASPAPIGGSPDFPGAPPPVSSAPIVSAGSVSAALGNGTNVEVEATSSAQHSGNVIVASSVTKTQGVDSTLTLNAANNVVFKQDVSVVSSQNKLNVFLSANATGGSIILGSNASIVSNGGNVTLENGADVLRYGSSIVSDGGDIALGAGELGAQGNNRHTAGIFLNGATLNAGGGNISLNGTGFSTALDYSYGVAIEGGSIVQTTGNGTISVAGTGETGAGNKNYVPGLGLPATTGSVGNSGVYITGSNTQISSFNGDIAVTGTGGGNGAFSSANNYGVYLSSGATVSALNKGNVSLTGTGGGNDATYTSGNAGVLVDSGATISVKKGTLSVVGSGGGNASYSSADNIGISLTSGTTLAAKGAGNVSLTGTGGGDNIYLTYDNYGVSVSGATVSVKKGTLSVAGFGGGNNTYGSTNDTGVLLTADARLTATSAGNISLTGTGGGNYATQSSGNTGVDVTSGAAASVARGTLSVTGFGGGNNTFESNKNGGILIASNAMLSATNLGSVSLSGTGGGNHAYSSTGNSGVAVTSKATASVANGTLSVTGFGGGNFVYSGTNNTGVRLTSGANLRSTNTGIINVTGVGGTDQLASNGNYGIVARGAASAGGKNASGNITFTADTIDFSHSVSVQTKNNVAFEPYTSSTSIGIAGADGTLQLTTIALNDVTAGSIIVGNTDRDTGTITANAYNWQAPVSLLNDTGDIAINGTQTMAASTFLADTAWGNIALGSSGGVTSSASGTAITLAASQGDFTNGNSDASALLTSNEEGRWLVYSGAPATDTFGNLTSNFYRYSCAYAGSCPSIPLGGNGYLFNVTPDLVVTVNNDTVTYGQTPVYSYTATETYSFKGQNYSITTDTASATVSSDYGVNTHNVGTYGITASNGTLPSELGYIFSSTPGILTVNQATLFVTGDDQIKGLGAATPPLTYSYSGLQYSDTGSVFSGGLTTVATDTMPGLYNINQGTLSAGGNYVIAYTPGTLFIKSPLSNLDSSAFERGAAHSFVKRGPSGTLLSIVSNEAPPASSLANLAPAAGGNNPTALADLSPSAGGGSVQALIQCNSVTPCDINQ